MYEYRIENERFESAADAIDHAFKLFAASNLNAVEIRKVKRVEPRGFMNAIDHDVVGSMVIKGPANYKIDALNNNF